MSPILWGGPSATLIRTAAKRAFSGPLVPRRQLSVRQGAVASVFSADTDFASGTWFLRGRPRPATGKMRATDLLAPPNAHGPGKATLAQTLPEGRGEAITSISQHAAKAQAGRARPIDLGERDLGLGPIASVIVRHAGPGQSRGIARPALGQEQPQPHHDRHFAGSQRQRHQGLAVGVLAQGRGVLRRDADRAFALLRKGRVVDDQPSLGAADHPVGLSEQGLLERRGVPNTAGDEVVKLVIADTTVTGRHRLDALAITGADQPRHIGRAHPRPHLVPQSSEKGRKPALKIGLPVLVHGRPSRKPTTHESRNPRRGNPKNASRPKILPK